MCTAYQYLFPRLRFTVLTISLCLRQKSPNNLSLFPEAESRKIFPNNNNNNNYIYHVMASFVTEVLSARGTLGDKDDFSCKIAKVQKKLQALKSSLQCHLEATYTDFISNISDTNYIIQQVMNCISSACQLAFQITNSKYQLINLSGS